MLNVWPDNRKQIDSAVRPYYNFRDEIALYQEVLLEGNRIIVPPSLRDEMRQKIHLGYLGIEKCQAGARSTLYCMACDDE